VLRQLVGGRGDHRSELAGLVAREWLAVVGKDVQRPFDGAVCALHAVDIDGGVRAKSMPRRRKTDLSALIAPAIWMSLSAFVESVP
jgi:hypothetical protein